MARVRSNRVCFTINNYTLEDILAFEDFNDAKIQYMVIGQEIGESGTPHLQGFIHIDQESKSCGLKFWKSYLPAGARAHFENARGSDEDNKKYCTKDGPFLEMGTPKKGAVSGKMQEIMETAKTDLEAAIHIDPGLGIRYFFQIQGIHKMYKQDKVPPTDITVLRPWQEWVIKRLDKQDDRKILFIVDRKGGRGKSCLATHLMSQGEAWVCEGKRAHFVPRGMGGRNLHNCNYVSPPPAPPTRGGLT